MKLSKQSKSQAGVTETETLLNIDQSSGKGRYVSSDHSFLFSLHAPSGPNVRKFNIKKKLFAVSHHPNCGPIFGAGELVAFDQSKNYSPMKKDDKNLGIFIG